MELLAPNEFEIIRRFAHTNEKETLYVIVIKRLMHLTEINTSICSKIFSIFNDIHATLKEAEILECDEVFSMLRSLDFKKLAHVNQNLLNARNDLVLGLSEIHTANEQWFSEKSERIENLINLYDEDIANNVDKLNTLQNLKAQVWLASEHSRMINHLGMR
jgi:hypothetical protein